MKRALIYAAQAVALFAVFGAASPETGTHVIVMLFGVMAYGALSQYQSFLNLEPLIRGGWEE